MNKKLAIVLALSLIAIVCCAGCIDPQDPVDPVDPVVPVDPVDPVTPPVDPVVPAEEYSVFFMLNYGEAGAYTAETVTAGDAVEKPANPTRSGYTFKGWFTAAEGGAEYDFTQAVNADLTLYAQWKKKSSSGSGHSHSYSWNVIKAANCTVDGEKQYACSCGQVKSTEVIPATGHTSTQLSGTNVICIACGETIGQLDNMVAQIGTNYYATFESAMKVANDGETITLLDDVTDGKVTKNVVIDTNNNVTTLTYDAGLSVANIKIVCSTASNLEAVKLGDEDVVFEVDTNDDYVASEGYLVVAYTKKGTTYTVYTDYGLGEAIDKVESGETILLTPRSYGVIDVAVNTNVDRTFTIAASGAGVKIAGIDGQSNALTSHITIKGVTIDNSLQTTGWYIGTSPNINPCVGVWGGSYTFEDCVFNVTGESKAETGVMSWWTTKTGIMNFKKCTFNGETNSARAMQIYGNYTLNVEECTFNTEKDYSIKYVGEPGLTATFKNNKVYNTVNFVQTGSAPYAGNGYSLVFTGNTLAEGIKHVYVDNDEGQIITIDGVRYVSSANQLAAAVASGATNLLLAPGEYNVKDCGGKTLTITGTKNAVLKIMNEGEDGCDYGFDGSTVTFNGIIIDTSANTGNYKGYARMTAIFNDCDFKGAYTSYNEQTFNGCNFNFNNGYFWTWGANSVTFDGCTFNGNSKAILAHGGAFTVITIKDCNFAATEKGYTGSGDNTAAVEIDPTGSNTYTINFEGTNSKTDSYSDWIRVKDESTGHTITGLN